MLYDFFAGEILLLRRSKKKWVKKILDYESCPKTSYK